jgi:hypothetical protein
MARIPDKGGTSQEGGGAMIGPMNKRALRQMANERITEYLRAIARDPKNAAAHAFLADAYVECGRLDDAIAAYQKAIDLDPHHSRLERAKLEKAIEARSGRVHTPITLCDNCQGETPAANRVCVHCGARIRMGFLEWLAQPENLKAVGKQTGIVMLVVAVVSTLFSALPLEVKGCVLIASLMVGAFYFLRALGG